MGGLARRTFRGFELACHEDVKVDSPPHSGQVAEDFLHASRISFRKPFFFKKLWYLALKPKY